MRLCKTYRAIYTATTFSTQKEAFVGTNMNDLTMLLIHLLNISVSDATHFNVSTCTTYFEMSEH